MDRRRAAALLGVALDAPPDEVRRAFRALIRARHPDQAGGTSAATIDSALLIEAHRTLRAPAPRPAAAPPPPSAPPRPRAATPVDARVDGDSLLIDDDPAVVMARLVEAGHQIGEITYLDRSSGYLEVLVQVCEPDDLSPAAVSLVASLQGRAEGIEVFCTAERLDGRPSPPVAPLVEALAEALAGRP